MNCRRNPLAETIQVDKCWRFSQALKRLVVENSQKPESNTRHSIQVRFDLQNRILTNSLRLRQSYLSRLTNTDLSCAYDSRGYAAVTDAKGHFEIPNLSVGAHEFMVWQESAGWLEKKYSVTIKEGMNEQPPLKFKASQILK